MVNTFRQGARAAFVSLCLAAAAPLLADAPSETSESSAAKVPKSLINWENNVFFWSATAEGGFIGFLYNEIQFGRNNGQRLYNYLTEGNQDQLYFFLRFSGDLSFKAGNTQHTFVFLYQPLQIRSVGSVLGSDLVVEDVTFNQGVPLSVLFGFDFYRISYLFDFVGDTENELAIGLSLQIRNANIEFSSLNGNTSLVNTDIGPVPALKFRAKYRFPIGLFIGTEIDGVIAPVPGPDDGMGPYFGSILDASIRAGYRLPMGTDLFFNVRYLGGGANVAVPGDDGVITDLDYTFNLIHTLTFSLGLTLQ